MDYEHNITYIIGHKWSRTTGHAVLPTPDNFTSECGLMMNYIDMTSKFDPSKEYSCKRCIRVIEADAKLLNAANKQRQ